MEFNYFIQCLLFQHGAKYIYDTDDDISISGLISYSYLNYFNFTYNFAISATGSGLRDYFRKGNITLNDVISVMPFEDYLVEFSISGKDLEFEFGSSLGHPSVAGIILEGKTFKIMEDGSFNDLDPNKLYSGVMIDYSFYFGGLERYGSTETGVHYRDPVIQYFKTLDNLQDHKFIVTGDNISNSILPSTSEMTNSQTSTITTPINTIGFIITLVLLVSIRARKLKERKK